PHRHRRRGAVARPAAAGAGLAARADRRGPRRRRRLSPRRRPLRPARRGRHRPAWSAAHAGHRRHFGWGTRGFVRRRPPRRGAGRLGGALVEETALIARWLVAPGMRIVRVADDIGWASPLRSAGAWAGWAAAARSARLATQQDPAPPARGLDSDLLAEPHPTR